MSQSKTTRLIAACFDEKSQVKFMPMTVHSKYESDHPVYRSSYSEPMAPVDVNSMNGDLLSLTWLQKGNLIKIPPIDQDDFTPLSMRSLNTETVIPRKETPLLVEDVKSVNLSNDSSVSPDQSLPTNGSDSQNINIIPKVSSPISFITSVNGSSNATLTKPNYSYTHLIFMAIESTPSKCMTVNQIYNWCEANFPFYKHAGAGWKNSLRHNLSINKSFKRLPRDGRLECAIVNGNNCVNTAAMGSFSGYILTKPFCLAKNKAVLRQRHSDTDESVEDYDLDDDDDSEGPGRGAYWAVEPRERPNLIDALKRNPWNLTAMTAAAAKIYENGTMNFAATLSALGGGRFGLAQSSPGRLLQASLDDSFSSDKSNNSSLSAANSALKLLQNGFPPTPHQMACLINACYPSLSLNENSINSISPQCQQQSIVCNELNEGDISHFGLCPSAISNASANRSPSPPPFNSEIVGAHPTEVCSKQIWAPDEEEKFDSMLKLLQESNSFNNEQLNNLNMSYGTGTVINQSSKVPLTNETSKGQTEQPAVQQPTSHEMMGEKGTSKRVALKQKRKSSLKPTLEADANSSAFCRLGYKVIIGNCLECKENKSSNGCEACHSRKLRYYSDFDRLEPQKPALSVLDQLDSDQEIGPAGVPALPRALSPEKSFKNEDGENHNSEDLQIDDENEATVTITPAPYLDHEYANCQGHLRGLNETKLVNMYNSRLRWELELRNNRGSNHVDHNNPYMENEIGSDDEFKKSFAFANKAKRSRNGRNSNNNLKRANTCSIGKQVLAKRRNVISNNTSIKEMTTVSRRSNRVIKAPKRPYDDIEGGYESDFDEDDEYEEMEQYHNRSKYDIMNLVDHSTNHRNSIRLKQRISRYANSGSEDELSNEDDLYYSDTDSSASHNKYTKSKIRRITSRTPLDSEHHTGEDLSEAEDCYSDLEEQYNMYVEGCDQFHVEKHNLLSCRNKCVSEDDTDSIEAEYLRLAKHRQATGNALSRQNRSKIDKFKYKSSGHNKARFATTELFRSSKAIPGASAFRRPQWLSNEDDVSQSPVSQEDDEHSVDALTVDVLNDSSETLPSHDTRDSVDELNKSKDGSDAAAKILSQMTQVKTSDKQHDLLEFESNSESSPIN